MNAQPVTVKCLPLSPRSRISVKRGLKPGEALGLIGLGVQRA